MANCKYCDKPAGLFRHTHKTCDTQFKSGCAQVLMQATSAINENADLDRLNDSLISIAKMSFIKGDEQRRLLVSAWEGAVDKFLDDGVLDREEEKCLVEYKDRFLLSNADLDKRGYLQKTVKALVLRDLLEGKLPQNVSLGDSVPLNLQKNEQVIWGFPGTEYLEDKAKRRFEGRSEGVSVRLMKGVYYRTSSFKGHPVDYTERVSQDTGVLVLTNKNLYFHGGLKSFRIPYGKIVSFQPFSDGIGIMRDAATAKNQIFVTGDGWFAYNIVSNIGNLEA